MTYSPDEAMTHSRAPITRLTGSGGGAKGTGLAGSYRALKETGITDTLEYVSGASAGAIAMSLIACGSSPNDLRKLSLETNLKDLMGDRILREERINGTLRTTRSGKPLYEMLREEIHKSIKEHLQHQEMDDPRIGAIREKLHSLNPVITFNDLAILHARWPETFKKLSVIAVRKVDGVHQIFNAENTPDVEIALAVRASASLPVVLLPVEITIGDETYLYVDGGLYDNLPTEYFDIDENGAPINFYPDQTLVLAFGEGHDNRFNPVFQALHGSNIAEIISHEMISAVINTAVDNANQFHNTYPNSDYTETLNRYIRQEAKKVTLQATMHTTKDGTLVANEIKAAELAAIIEAAANKMLSNSKTRKLLDSSTTSETLIDLLKKAITPVLYNASVFQRFVRNTLVSKLGGVNSQYTNTDQKEKGYQKLRTKYAFRTVELRVGNITTQDFKSATRFARLLDSLAYLDTMAHIINYNLLHSAESNFNEKEFFSTTVKNFLQIHKAVLFGANLSRNALTDEILRIDRQKSSGEQKNREMFNAIKDYVEKNPGSTEAFALTRAVEYRSKLIDPDTLFKEVYEEAFKRSSMFSQSKITDKTIRTSKELHQALKNQSMFTLFRQKEEKQGTRAEKIYKHLHQMDDFRASSAVKPIIGPDDEATSLSL